MSDLEIGELFAGLGFRPKSRSGSSWLDLFDKVEEGLPLASLDTVVKQVAPNDAGLKYRIVPKATLSRRVSAKRLSPEESARLVRLTKVWAFARDIWQDDGKARRFLFEPHVLLHKRRPIDLIIANDIGATMVTDILGRLRYGSAA